jgi:hypothetical protein
MRRFGKEIRSEMFLTSWHWAENLYSIIKNLPNLKEPFQGKGKVIIISYVPLKLQTV